MTDSWTFDDNVARDFDAHARAHIPHYEEVVAKSVALISSLFPDLHSTRIIDIGSATGYTLEKLRACGYQNVYGVDSSADMLRHSRVSENLIHATEFPAEHGPFHAIIANWTLHFVEAREKYLSTIRESLTPDGIFILSEKMLASELVHEHYHQFKRDQGVSSEIITLKAQSLEGVLIPKPLEWYLTTLQNLHFRDIELIDASWNFKTLLCRT